MKAKLPRIMLWKDKTSMEEFLHEPINERLYDFYLELKNTRWHFGPDNNALLLFNEIYYQLTKVEYENNLDFNFDDYTQEIETKTGKEHSIVLVYNMIFAFLLLRQNNSIVLSHFQYIVFNRYNKTWNERAQRSLGSIINEDKKYQVELKPNPCRVNDLEKKELQWDEITNNFNPSSIKEVLDIWSSKEEKILVLHLIEVAYKRISRRPVKMEYAMNYIRAGAYISNLYSELGDNDEIAATIKEYMERFKNIESENTCNTFPDSVPEAFKSLEAKQLMQKLVNAGLLTTDWQPKGLSIAERGYLAGEITSRLQIKRKWKVMGALWKENPETLRGGKNKAVEQKKTGDFIDKLKNILR